jgi:hypothetical protein
MKLYISILLIVLCSFSASAQLPAVTYEKVKLANIGSILIPSIMELQAGTYKELSDKYSKEIGYDVSGNIIFQQIGRNDILKKSPTYARVMIKETLGKAKDYRKITSKIVITKQQLKALDAEMKAGLINEFQAVGVGLKLLRWDGVSISTVNSRYATKVAYLRQLNNNPPVYVELYYIENYDREYLLTISYRQEDAPIWEDVLQTTKDSFTVTNIK